MSSQAALVAELLRSGCLEQPVERIDTHGAVVLLSGRRAIKIKRDVRFPFLDYSTLEKRRRACEAELAVNRVFAPDIYKRVLAIRRDSGGNIKLNGEAGEIVEWAVEMRRFDEQDVLENVLARDGISTDLARKLAKTVFDAHARAPVSDTGSWLRSLRSFIKENGVELQTSNHLFPQDRIESITAKSLERYERLLPMLRDRGADGFVRHYHGDLHLGNVVLIEGKPVLFDAIEFDPVIAAGDILYDLAFLLMDLVRCGQMKAANTLLNEYLACSHHSTNLEGLAALPLFMSVRAAIRAKVSLARVQVVSPDKKGLWNLRALSYLELADRLLTPCRGALVAVGGLSGTGKSTAAAAITPDFLPEPGAILLRSDLERKTMFSVSSDIRLPETAYSKEASLAVYQRLATKAGKVIAAGFTAIVDAVFGSEMERNAIASVARSHGVPFIGLFLVADLKTRATRVKQRRGDASDADEKVVQMQAKYDLGEITWTRIDASGDLGSIIKAARSHIRKDMPALSLNNSHLAEDNLRDISGAILI